MDYTVEEKGSKTKNKRCSDNLWPPLPGEKSDWNSYQLLPLSLPWVWRCGKKPREIKLLDMLKMWELREIFWKGIYESSGIYWKVNRIINQLGYVKGKIYLRRKMEMLDLKCLGTS